MAITALQGLLKTMCTALGQPRLLGKMAHALCTRFTKRLENPQTFLPNSHVGLVLERVAELSPEFSSSAYLTDTQLSRLKRVPQCIKRQQLPKQFVDEQARDLIEPGDPSDLTVDAQPQKCLHCDCDASYSVNIRPSHEFHGGQFL